LRLRGRLAFSLLLAFLRSLVRWPNKLIAFEINSRSVMSYPLANKQRLSNAHSLAMLALNVRSNALSVDREPIRLLALVHGLEETAKRTGIKLNTLLSWSARYNWFQRDKSGQPVLHSTDAIKRNIAPADAHLAIMEDRKRQSAVNLSRYICDASAKLAESKGNLKHARPGKDIVAMRSGIYPEANATALFSLNVLNLGDGNVTIGASHSDSEEKQADARDV